VFHKLRYISKLSLRFFLEQELLRDGQYDVITSGTQFYDGSDMSVLVPDTSAQVLAELGGVQAGQVWQSAFKNWVYENPPALNPSVILRNWPTAHRASGVYIDGAFRLENDAVYPHHIDYLNGRIIFDSPLPLDTRVHGDFTYKTVKVMSLREFNNQLKFGVLEQQYTTNPLTAGQLIYPSGTTRISPLPIIFIEDMGRTYGSYQIGDRSLIANDEMVCEIWTLDEGSRDNLIDLVAYQHRKSYPIINYNVAPLPLSGLRNELSPAYVPYISLAQNEPLPADKVPEFSGINSVAFRGFIEDTEVLDLDSFFNETTTQQDVFERAVVRMVVQTYPIMPVTPFGFDIALEGIDGRNFED
jgi:hypothetical protein